MFLSHEACSLVGQRAGPEGEFHVEHWKAGQGARTQLPTPVPWDRPPASRPLPGGAQLPSTPRKGSPAER